MIEKFDSYKESGIKWMGKIPSNWLLTKNRYGFKKHNNGKNEKDNTPVLSLTTKGVKVKTNLNFGKSTESYIGHQLVEKGDIVFTPRDFDQTPILSGVSEYNGCISNLYIVDKVKKEVLNYFVNYYWHGLKYSVDYFKNFSHGIRHSFNRFQFDEIPLLIPPISEQKLICSYLDKKTENIDKLIDIIQRKIELLKEQRTTLINQYVTKGLDPNVEMKDSGVVWIGEIPKHWKVKKFSYISTLETGNTPSKTQEELYFTEDEKGFPWVKPGDLNVGFDGVSITETRLTEEGKKQSRVVPKNSILVCCIGNTSGKFSISNCDVSTNQQINSITFNDEVLPRFGLYFMDVFRKDLLKWINFVTLPIISKGDLSKEPIMVPPMSEQVLISEHLDKVVSNFKVLQQTYLKKIKLLEEYRQSLIYSVVMGKVRVTEDMV